MNRGLREIWKVSAPNYTHSPPAKKKEKKLNLHSSSEFKLLVSTAIYTLIAREIEN
jgi:hypothetical protein